jgi:site-specific DNA-methyltransferase (adenine-specific)
MNKIECIDNIEGMQKLDKNSVNLCITSPPYNVGDETHNPIKYNEYEDVMDLKGYLSWMMRVFKEVYRVLTPDGRLVLNVGAKKNGRIPMNYYFTLILLRIGFKVYSQIIWDKGHTSRNSAFGSWLKPSTPSFITTFEYILVFYKNQRTLVPEYHKTTETDLTKDEFVKYARAMWSFPGVKSDIHPAPFPLELPTRAIKMLSYKEDQILDPFCGSGTTCAAAWSLHRDSIGFDIDPKYINFAKKWVGNFKDSLKAKE